MFKYLDILPKLQFKVPLYTKYVSGTDNKLIFFGYTLLY